MSNSKPESEGQGEATTPTTEGTEVLPESADDVLVLLPEGAEGEVPVVETEAVEEDLASTNTEVVDTSGSLDDVPLKRVNPLTDDGSPEPLPAPEPAGFEDLAAESDEDLFGSQSLEEEKVVRSAKRKMSPERPRPVAEFFPAAGAGSQRSGRSWKLPIGVAALVLFGAGGYLSYPHWKHLVESQVAAISTPRSRGTTPVPGDGVKTPRPGTTAPSPDLVRASKEAFREKFLLTVELGYVGEVSNE
jgi:hypothetical protein